MATNYTNDVGADLDTIYAQAPSAAYNIVNNLDAGFEPDPNETIQGISAGVAFNHPGGELLTDFLSVYYGTVVPITNNTGYDFSIDIGVGDPPVTVTAFTNLHSQGADISSGGGIPVWSPTSGSSNESFTATSSNPTFSEFVDVSANVSSPNFPITSYVIKSSSISGSHIDATLSLDSVTVSSAGVVAINYSAFIDSIGLAGSGVWTVTIVVAANNVYGESGTDFTLTVNQTLNWTEL